MKSLFLRFLGPTSRFYWRALLALALVWMAATAWPSDFSLSFVGKWPAWTQGPAYAVAVSGDYAYLAAGTGGLFIIDIRDPAKPQRVGGYDTSGSALGVAVAGNYAYVAAYGRGLQVIDTRDPAHPQWVGGYPGRCDARAVAVADNYAYVADCLDGLEVIDIRDPANPQRVGGYDTSGWGYGVAVAGNYAYVADGDAGLEVIDIGDPANPQRVGGYDTLGSALHVAVAGDYAYVADGYGGLVILSFGAPVAPTISAQPQGCTVFAGEPVTFSVVASGYPTPQYQWRFNGSDLPGETNASLSFSAVTTSQAGTYSVVVSNPLGSVASSNAVLTVILTAGRLSLERSGTALELKYWLSSTQGVVTVYESDRIEWLWTSATVLQTGPAPAGASGTVVLTNWAGWPQRFFRLGHKP
jgi:hypothetical protein